MNQPITYHNLTKKLLEFRRNHFQQKSLVSELEMGLTQVRIDSNLAKQLKILKSHYKQRRTLESSQSSADSSLSPTADQSQQSLSIEGVLSLVIDPTVYEAVHLEGKRTDKKQHIDPDWSEQTKIIILDYDQQLMPSTKQIEKFFLESFKERPFVKFKDFRLGIYHGKLSIVINMKEDKAAQFLYYNLVTMTNKYKKNLGENIKIAQLKKLRQRSKGNDKNSIVMRVLPLDIRRDLLEDVCDGMQVETFQYKRYQYAIIRSNDFDTSIRLKNKLVEFMNSRNLLDVRINVLGYRKPNKNNDPLNFQIRQHIECLSPSELQNHNSPEDGEISNNDPLDEQQSQSLNPNQNQRLEPKLEPVQFIRPCIIAPPPFFIDIKPQTLPTSSYQSYQPVTSLQPTANTYQSATNSYKPALFQQQ